MLHDPARLLRLLSHPEHPIQLVIAGKAHSADVAGQALIQRWIEFTQLPGALNHVVFLNDYDMQMAEHLYKVWMFGSTRRGGPYCLATMKSVDAR